MTWKLIAYMLSHSEEYLSKVGLIQPTLKLMKSDTYKAMPYANVFKEDMERSHIVYYGENSAKIQDQIREAVESVMLAGASPEAAAGKAEKKGSRSARGTIMMLPGGGREGTATQPCLFFFT